MINIKNRKEWKEYILFKDAYICQKCGSLDKLEAHHIKQTKTNPELILNINNGLTLCRECHRKIPRIRKIPNRQKMTLVKVDFSDELESIIKTGAKKIGLSFPSYIRLVLACHFNNINLEISKF